MNVFFRSEICAKAVGGGAGAFGPKRDPSRSAKGAKLLGKLVFGAKHDASRSASSAHVTSPGSPPSSASATPRLVRFMARRSRHVGLAR